MPDTVQARITESDAAEVAFARFIGPALTVLREDYTRKLAEIAAQPMEGRILAGVEKLALGIKVLNEVEAQLRGLIADGKVATAEAERASTLVRMNGEARRWANY